MWLGQASITDHSIWFISTRLKQIYKKRNGQEQLNLFVICYKCSRQTPVPYGSKLYTPPTNCHLATQQEIYKNRIKAAKSLNGSVRYKKNTQNNIMVFCNTQKMWQYSTYYHTAKLNHLNMQACWLFKNSINPSGL